MKLSLVKVLGSDDSGGFVWASWLQNYVGTVDDAKALAKELEAANGNKIKVAVVSEIPSCRPELGYWKNLKPL